MDNVKKHNKCIVFIIKYVMTIPKGDDIVPVYS
jgi:hypothetical protein